MFNSSKTTPFQDDQELGLSFSVFFVSVVQILGFLGLFSVVTHGVVNVFPIIEEIVLT